MNAVIKLEHVFKDFRVYHEKNKLFADKLVNPVRGKKGYEILHVLKDLSFEVNDGEMLGIIGKNGAGKTTLLKILAGIIKPTSGQVTINGKLIPFIELGVGFSYDMTAINNIILYGMLLGFSKKEISQKIPQILEYAELEKFGDTVIKNFSAGMRARLAFSTAILVNPDILLVDEILSVGDYSFQQKSFNTFMDIKRRKKTIVFVSHNLDQIRKLCDRAMLLYDGKIEAIGEPDMVVRKYLEMYYIDQAPKISTSETTDLGLKSVFPDNSPFLRTGADQISANRLRYRTRMLVEKNLFAIKGKSVLDLGCHDGRFMYASLTQGAKFVLGIEARPNMVDLADANLQYYQIDRKKYQIIKDDIFNTMKNIEPNTIDTVLVFGIFSKTVYQPDLIYWISRIKPKHVIIDTDIDSSLDPIISLDNEDHRFEHNTIRADNIVGIPSRTALEILLSTYGFKFSYLNWNNEKITDWTDLQDYKDNKRISLVATMINDL